MVFDVRLMISALFSVGVGVIGVQLLRFRLGWCRVLNVVAATEVVYFVAILWFGRVEAGWTENAIAVTELADTPWIIQLLTAFPLWGPLIAGSAAREQKMLGEIGS